MLQGQLGPALEEPSTATFAPSRDIRQFAYIGVPSRARGARINTKSIVIPTAIARLAASFPNDGNEGAVQGSSQEGPIRDGFTATSNGL